MFKNSQVDYGTNDDSIQLYVCINKQELYNAFAHYAGYAMVWGLIAVGVYSWSVGYWGL